MKFYRYITYLTVLVSAFIGLMAATAFAQTYVAPSKVFSGSVSPAINSALTDQRKIGSLGIGSTTSPQKLCLNATGTSDGTHCISTWGSLANQFGGPFVGLTRNAFAYDVASVNCGPTTPSDLCAGDYTLQSGYIHLKASSTTTPQQAFTTVVQDPNLQMCSYDRLSGDQAPGFCNFGPNQGAFCYTNTDCGYVSTAVYANDNGSSANAAAYISGVAYVTAPTNDPGLGLYGRICLNGTVENAVNQTPGGVCISSWNEITNGTGSIYVKRQTGNPPGTAQTLGAAISGVISLGSAVTGSTLNLPRAYTCGDGVCSANTNPPENAITCPIDCSGVPTPGFSVSMSAGVTDMTVTPKSQLPSGNVGILIVRTNGSSSTFFPVNGVTYTIGQVIGNATVVYVGSVAQNVTISPHPTDTITNSGTYSYRAFQSNSFPVYSPIPGDASIQAFRLTVSFSPAKGSLYDTLGGINCFTSGTPGCTTLYQSGLSDSVVVDVVSAGYAPGSWAGCDSTPSIGECDLTMNADRSVFVSFTASSGGGGGGTGGCFIAGTLVDTPFGQRPIDQLAIGDPIYSYDPANGQTVVARVSQTFVHYDRQYGQVTFSDGTRLEVTSVHPFYNARAKVWQEIGTMHVGDTVLQHVGNRMVAVSITSLEFTSGRGTVYNIEVNGFHDYYVHGILVHNKVTGGV